MSFLHLPSVNLSDCSRGTISLWFRLSGDSVAAALAHGQSYQPVPELAPDIFRRTIPLVTFGRRVMAKMYDTVPHQWMEVHGEPPAVYTASTIDTVEVGEAPAEPSHLGLEVDNDGIVRLKMVFQTESRAHVQGLNTQTTNMTWHVLEPGNPNLVGFETVIDISYIRTAIPERFVIIPSAIAISLDVWHHLLVSFDFSSSVNVVAYEGSGLNTDEEVLSATISSYCKFWYAFDDHNYSGGQANMGDGWVPHNANGIVPVTAKEAAFSFVPSPPSPTISGELYDPEYRWGATPVPVHGGHMALPASPTYVDTIYHCEMAEFQFFGNFTVDPSAVNVRRAFVAADGTPTPPETTEEMLGQRPDILLTTTSDWQEGKNTGAIGLQRNPDGSELVLEAGQFSPTGRIEDYEPDPQLS